MDKLKFSDLLLMGAKRVFQCKHNFVEYTGENRVESACAIGMMAVAKSGSLDAGEVDEAVSKLNGQLRALSDPGLNTRLGRPQSWTLDSCITHANDELDMSPEQIAELLSEYGY